MKQRSVMVVLVASFGIASAAAQTPVFPAAPNYSEYSPATNLPQQRLGPEDLITLGVYDSPEFSRTVRVATDGSIRLPILKSPIHVQGLLPSEAEKTIAEALKTEGLLNDPFVTVTVSEYKSRPINVMGAVRNPTIFQVIGKVTILDALARAGGLADNAGPVVIVTKAEGTSDAPSVRRILIKPLLDGSAAESNLTLIGGEEVRVPIVSQIVVQGNVTKPGVYPVLDPLSTNTVTAAIAQAGGLSQYWEHTAYIYRTDNQGTKHTIEVPLAEILKRKKPDILMEARDVLYVPDSPRRRITQETVQAVTGVATSVTAGAAIYATHP